MSEREALHQSTEPTRLYHGLSGWPPKGPNAFRWENGRLVYMFARVGVHHSEWDEAVTPSSRRWEDLWRVCEEIDVWSWLPTQGDMYAKDGLQWTTELEFGGQSVASRGQVHGSPPGFDGKLMRLHRTLQAMTGWHDPDRNDCPGLGEPIDHPGDGAQDVRAACG
jgi:hypothetical protein